ncbi:MULTISPECIES: hypothetical protein [unclassified Streptomyces]|uniref:hypothetical protein n=1 Tax=unclassified Streptomyces TaxID=2593676 RepID=UPI0033B54E79|nr:hypothetical protein OG199_22255 [Streptomyces sp. NBC_01176]
MPNDPYAVLRALLRAEAARNAPKPNHDAVRPHGPDEGRDTPSPSSLTSPAVAPRKRGRG